ncbi:MAG TPA: hypothetical protein PLE74_03335 [Candidatus Cloacimonadota bacterium]|nr:hypothetical protein [Candidatus Cloacimonadota bacterium]HPT71294.1 hypothetical protein [Candidatus Cloacimonadota bacterium]
MFHLDDIHLEKAKELVLANRKKKSCNTCYDRGYTGITQENTLLICPKCVDEEKAMTAWKEYVETIPELKEHFHELFEEHTEEASVQEKKEEHHITPHHEDKKTKPKFAAGAPTRRPGTRKVGER